jgi:metal-sulfur cluster biosynthetic enzyme
MELGEELYLQSVKEFEILEALKEVRDPEIPLDIVNLGLIYGVQVKGRTAYIDMTFTVPSCPAKSEKCVFKISIKE